MKTKNKTKNIKPKFSRSTKTKNQKKNGGGNLEKNPRKQQF
jgi:hypothetical protein